jgi:hypothetical protein
VNVVDVLAVLVTPDAPLASWGSALTWAGLYKLDQLYK